jgi:hypothetical protein
LLLLNFGLYAWSQGWLGATPAQGSGEPDRLTRQVAPDVIRVSRPESSPPRAGQAPASAALATAPAAASASSATPVAADAPASNTAATSNGAATCLQAGPFLPNEVAKIEGALQSALPNARASWADVKIETPGIWLVYMGKFTDRDTLLAKQEELKRFRNLSFEEVQGAPALEPGISLGRYDSRNAAEASLAKLVERGVRTARVVALSPPAVVHTLRVERADAALKTQLLGLPPSVLAGTAFAPCALPAAAPATSAGSPN